MAESNSEEIIWKGRPLDVPTAFFKTQKLYYCPFGCTSFYDPARLIGHLDAEHLHSEFLEGQRFELIVFHKKGGEKHFRCPGCGREDRNPRRLAEHLLIGSCNRLNESQGPMSNRPAFVRAPPPPTEEDLHKQRFPYPKELYHPGGGYRVVWGPEEHAQASLEGWRDEPEEGINYTVWTAVDIPGNANEQRSQTTSFTDSHDKNTEVQNQLMFEDGTIPSTEGWGEPLVKPVLALEPSRYSLVGGPQDSNLRQSLYREVFVLARRVRTMEGLQLVAGESAADWWLARVTGSDQGEFSVQDILVLSIDECREWALISEEAGKQERAQGYDRLGDRFDELLKRYFGTAMFRPVPEGPAVKVTAGSEEQLTDRQALSMIQELLAIDNRDSRNEAFRLRSELEGLSIGELAASICSGRRVADATARTACNRWKAKRMSTPMWANELIPKRLLQEF